MLDRSMLALLKPGVDRLAATLVRRGLRADSVTWLGFGLGLLAAAAIASRWFLAGLVLLLLSRLADALDGAVARQTAPTDRGAFLDITLDFIFYASIPLAFALADPAANALAAAALLAAFIGTGSSFLAYAALAAQRGKKSVVYPTKGIYYLGGLTEASETILCFVLMCLLPQWFAALAWAFAALCAITIVTRLHAGWRELS